MKQLLSAIILLVCFFSEAQNFEDSWTGHFSYASVRSISEGNGKIYAASENAIFIYDISTQEIETISTINGLSGESISSLYYSETFGLLFIGYETGLIEVVIDGEENVLTVVDILDKPTIPPNEKNINHFNEYEGNLYIAAEFGISVYDLSALEFGDTYFIGNGGARLNITQTAIDEEFIYASSTNGGLRRAVVENDNLIDFNQWQLVTGGNLIGVQEIAGELFIANSANQILQKNGNTNAFTTVANFGNETIVDFNVKNNLLNITTSTSIQAYNSIFQLQDSVTTLVEFEDTYLSGIALNNAFYIGTLQNGLLQVPFGNIDAFQILPNGPVDNNTFSIDATPGQLWAVFGDVSVTFNPFPLTRRGISNLQGDSWVNITYEELSETLGKDANDLVNVAINPENPSEVYISSFNKGLLRIEDQVPTILYDDSNSPLESFTSELDIRIFGSDYDREGNLWFVQSRIDEALLRLNPSGQFQKVDLSPIIEDPSSELALTELSISREGFVFFGAVDSGVIGYNPQTGDFNKIAREPGNGNLPTNNVRALTFDNNNRLWIGTLQGIRVFFNVGGFFEDDASIESQEIIIEENGIGQEFLFDISITDIEVDGSNNKWISTATSGVFYVSPNAQETLLRFTKDNSPLPSNNVQDIAIDSESGVVYFATNQGLVAYRGSATAPSENLENVRAFPNPVRPGFTGNVTIDGLTEDANIKITDLEGNLVFETTSEGGSVLWDTTAFGRYKVRSGVYFVLITSEDALETKVSKIMIIR
ncbi:two-component regulator propeller domain-containing protein [Jejudonia soesokkakensis]|uniref:Two-component regulator propeller domain-containing protein n=1 Tax=Jejudonia soesokkakensis TaxID=1323432 RepID=A0ABW2MW49_9FLAO